MTAKASPWHAAAVALTAERFVRDVVAPYAGGFMLAENLIDLRQSELMIDKCTDAAGGLR